KPAESILKKYYLGINLSVEIVRPRNGYLYVFDREIMHTGKTMAIGRITIEADAANARRVEFYIDNELKFNDTEKPYSWQWNEISFGEHEIKATAYNDGEYAESSITILKII
ncbi:MAG: hypothetical protein J7K61_02515, partial [Thermoplasmata archaeon]|nr:hypothetical protein [Thermoplasmata archaeon]